MMENVGQDNRRLEGTGTAECRIITGRNTAEYRVITDRNTEEYRIITDRNTAECRIITTRNTAVYKIWKLAESKSVSISTEYCCFGKQHSGTQERQAVTVGICEAVCSTEQSSWCRLHTNVSMGMQKDG
jgi:hypothetical protein